MASSGNDVFLPSVIVKVAVDPKPPLLTSCTTITFSPRLRDDTAIDSGNVAVRK